MKSIIEFLKRNRIYMYLVIIMVIAIATTMVYAASVPNTFVPDTVISSSEMNENFEALKTAIESQAQLSFSGSYGLPFSSSGALADRNVLVLKYVNSSDNSINYSLRIFFVRHSRIINPL